MGQHERHGDEPMADKGTKVAGDVASLVGEVKIAPDKLRRMFNLGYQQLPDNSQRNQ